MSLMTKIMKFRPTTNSFGGGVFRLCSTTLRHIDASESVLTLLSSVSQAEAICPNSPYWLSLQKRASSPLALSGIWFVSQFDTTATCLIHLVPNNANSEERKASKWRLQLWSFAKPASADQTKQSISTTDLHINSATVTAVASATEAAANHIAESLSPQNKVVKVVVAALDRSLLSSVDDALCNNSALKMNRDYHACVGLYAFSFVDSNCLNMEPPVLPPNFTFRELSSSDSELVDSKWEYRSATSISDIRAKIESPNCCCIGIFVDEEEKSNESGNSSSSSNLCAWILQYQDGPLGLLYCEEEYRGKGFGTALIAKAMQQLQCRNESKAFAYIVDGNKASERAFQRLGWKRIQDADWVGFSAKF